MPSTIIPNSTASLLSTQPSSRIATGTFTGTVYMDSISTTKPSLSATDNSDPSKIMLNHVFFTPSSRTFWHTHERGQILEVKMGSGWVCDRGAKPRRIRTGDVVVCEAGTEHWHGADEGSVMMHLAVSLGVTSWKEEVGDGEWREGIKGQ